MGLERRRRTSVNRASLDRGRGRRTWLALTLPVLLCLWPASAGAQELSYPSVPLTVAGSHEYTLDVACPAGTVVLGGGWTADAFLAAAMSSDPSTAPSKNAWHLWGQNVDEFSQSIAGVASCAPAEAFPAGSLQYPASASVTLDPYPAKSHISGIAATCPGGYVPISGGFENHEDGGLPDTGIGISVPSWAVEKNTTGNAWLIGAENFEDYLLGQFQSWEVSALTTCVSSGLAFGVFQMNANGERQLIEEPAVTTASCATGNVVSGAFATFDSDGTEVLYSGNVEGMYFNSSGTGFSIRYSSGHVDHHTILVLGICADIAPAIASLDQADFETACQVAMPGQSGVHAVAGQTATDWRCTAEDGSSVPIPGNQGAWTCAALGHFSPTATYLSKDDPNSWACYGLPDGAQPASKVKGSATPQATTAKGKKKGSAGTTRVSVSGRAKVLRPVGNLGRAKVIVPATLLEASGAGDLLRNGKRAPVHPTVLKARGRHGSDFVYTGGSKPRLTMRLRLTKNKKAYRFQLNARGGRLAKPRLCDSGPKATTHLTTRFLIEAGQKHPTDVAARSYWKCRGKALVTAQPALRLP